MALQTFRTLRWHVVSTAIGNCSTCPEALGKHVVSMATFTYGRLLNTSVVSSTYGCNPNSDGGEVGGAVSRNLSSWSS